MAEVQTEATKATSGKPGKRRTLLNEDVSMPGFVAPGDGPHDTVDPAEHASSVTPDKGAAARKGFGVVNAVVPMPPPASSGMAKSDGEDRVESYEVPGPDGKPVRVTHNLETGETSAA